MQRKVELCSVSHDDRHDFACTLQDVSALGARARGGGRNARGQVPGSQLPQGTSTGTSTGTPALKARLQAVCRH
jgi:hypothetical protein